MNPDTENVSTLTNKNNHSFPLLLKWGCRLGKSGMIDVENLGFKLIPRAQTCPELPLTNMINVDTSRSCLTLSRGSPVDFRCHSSVSERCMVHKQGSHESCSFRVPRAHPAAERTCASNRDHPKGKSSKRWSLPCPSDYLSGSESFSHTWHKIKEKITTISLANVVSWTGEDFEGRGWLFVSGANQFLPHCWIHAVGYLVLP